VFIGKLGDPGMESIEDAETSWRSVTRKTRSPNVCLWPIADMPLMAAFLQKESSLSIS